MNVFEIWQKYWKWEKYARRKISYANYNPYLQAADGALWWRSDELNAMPAFIMIILIALITSTVIHMAKLWWTEVDKSQLNKKRTIF